MTAEVLPYPKAWNNLSSVWNLIPLKFGFDQIGSGTTPPTGNEEYYGGGIPWVTTSELRENVVETTEKTVSSLALQQFSSLKLYPPNTVMIAMYGATIGRIGLLGTKACVNQAVLAMAHPTLFEPRFVAYALQASRDFLLSLGSGGGQPNLNAEKIKNFIIPCPSIFIQKNIVEYLDEKTAVIDQLITAKERLLTLLNEKRRALITHAVTRGLDPTVPLRDSGVEWIGRVPEHWDVLRIRQLMKSMDYGISERVGTEGKTAVLRMGDIGEGEIDFSNVGFVDEVDESMLLKEGDLLFNRTNSLEHVGKVALFRGNFEIPSSFASYLVRLRCKNYVLPEYLNYALNSAPILTWARSEALPAIGQANLNPNRYSYLFVTLPPQKEQEEIVHYLEQETAKLDNLKQALQKTIALLQERRTALIAAAVSGQHPVADQS